MDKNKSKSIAPSPVSPCKPVSGGKKPKYIKPVVQIDSYAPNKKFWFHKKTLRRVLGGYAIGQSPYGFPDNLKEVLDHVESKMVVGKYSKVGMFNVTQKQLRQRLNSILKVHPQVVLWNTPKANPTAQFVSCSRYHTPHPDYDIIDIDALIMNVCRDMIKHYDE